MPWYLRAGALPALPSHGVQSATCNDRKRKSGVLSVTVRAQSGNASLLRGGQGQGRRRIYPRRCIMFIDTSPRSLEQTWPPEPVSVPHTRHFLREALDHWGLQAVGDEAAVVLSELATNAVIHAGTDFTVRISASGEQRLHLSVSDGSTVMPRWASDRLATDGRGLRLIDALSTEWGVMLSGVKGKTVWALLTADHMTDKDLP